MDKLSSRDFLSDLPLSIIHTILELVPIRDAVKTSILSRQWRYKWASLPHLAFVDECGSDEIRMIDFINQALFLHKGCIHKFKLKVSFMENCHYINQWRLFLSRNEIRMLVLDGEDDEYAKWFCTRSSLYSCQNLSHLELSECEIPPPPPTFKGFLCLRCLVLNDVGVSSSTIASIVANSPLLEELTINSSASSEGSELRIRAPNLKHLHLRGCKYIYAPLLVKMSVIGILDSTAEHLQQNISACNYTKFLGCFTNLEELNADYSFLEQLSKGIESCQRSLVFHRLRIIKLCLLSFDDIKQLSVVVRLITDASNLQKLKISSLFGRPLASEVASVSFWDSVCASNFILEQLKVIEMMTVCGVRDEMELIKFLLASSPVLEKMIINPHQDLTEQRPLNLTADLLRYRRASTNAEILYGKR